MWHRLCRNTMHISNLTVTIVKMIYIHALTYFTLMCPAQLSMRKCTRAQILGNRGPSNAQLKEELHNRFNLISEERVKFFKHNSENLMKIGWKIRKLWHFEVSQIFTKHFLTSRYEYANEWVDDVITSLLAIYFVHKILKILIFCPNLW